jgi:hypothetical protein
MRGLGILVLGLQHDLSVLLIGRHIFSLYDLFPRRPPVQPMSFCNFRVIILQNPGLDGRTCLGNYIGENCFTRLGLDIRDA